MPNKQVILWIVPIVARGIAWVFAAKLAMSVADSQSAAQAIAESLGALVLAVASVYTSVHERKRLLKKAK